MDPSEPFDTAAEISLELESNLPWGRSVSFLHEVKRVKAVTVIIQKVMIVFFMIISFIVRNLLF